MVSPAFAGTTPSVTGAASSFGQEVRSYSATRILPPRLETFSTFTVNVARDCANASWETASAVSNTAAAMTILCGIGSVQEDRFAKDSVYARAVFARVIQDRKSTRLNSSHGYISYAVFCLKKK